MDRMAGPAWTRSYRSLGSTSLPKMRSAKKRRARLRPNSTPVTALNMTSVCASRPSRSKRTGSWASRTWSTPTPRSSTRSRLSTRSTMWHRGRTNPIPNPSWLCPGRSSCAYFVCVVYTSVSDPGRFRLMCYSLVLTVVVCRLDPQPLTVNRKFQAEFKGCCRQHKGSGDSNNFIVMALVSALVFCFLPQVMCSLDTTGRVSCERGYSLTHGLSIGRHRRSQRESAHRDPSFPVDLPGHVEPHSTLCPLNRGQGVCMYFWFVCEREK